MESICATVCQCATGTILTLGMMLGGGVVIAYNHFAENYTDSSIGTGKREIQLTVRYDSPEQLKTVLNKIKTGVTEDTSESDDESNEDAPEENNDDKVEGDVPPLTTDGKEPNPTPPTTSEDEALRLVQLAATCSLTSFNKMLKPQPSRTAPTGGYATLGQLAGDDNESVDVKVRRAREKDIMGQVFGRITMGQSYHTANEAVKALGYRLHPLYNGIGAKTPLPCYDSKVIGVRIKDAELDPSKRPSPGAIVNEIIDVGGIDEEDRGVIKI